MTLDTSELGCLGLFRTYTVTKAFHEVRPNKQHRQRTFVFARRKPRMQERIVRRTGTDT